MCQLPLRRGQRKGIEAVLLLFQRRAEEDCAKKDSVLRYGGF